MVTWTPRKNFETKSMCQLEEQVSEQCAEHSLEHGGQAIRRQEPQWVYSKCT